MRRAVQRSAADRHRSGLITTMDAIFICTASNQMHGGQPLATLKSSNAYDGDVSWDPPSWTASATMMPSRSFASWTHACRIQVVRQHLRKL